MSAPALLATQRQMQALLLGEVAGDPAGLLDPASARGLAVYRHAYRARLIAALRDNYPVLVQVMGDEDFDALASAYVQARPSAFASIRWYGDGLADYMATEAAPAHPAFIDVARMDWALRGVFDASEDSALTLDALQQLDTRVWPRLRLQPRASARCLPLAWAVEPAWAALARHAQQREAGEAADEPELPAPEPLDHQLLAWRPQLETRWRSLQPEEGALVAAVFEGADWTRLGEVAAAQWGEAEAAARLVGCLQQWVQEGWLRALA